MNQQRGNMYPWVTHTWNPIRGCRHNCPYCYVRRLRGYDMTARLSEKALGENLGQGNTIFVGSTGDMFGAWVPKEWIFRVLAKGLDFSENTYLFQTKNPARFDVFLRPVDFFPPRRILGTTIETNRYLLPGAPSPQARFLALRELFGVRRMVSIEPVMDFDLGPFIQWLREIAPEFVSIGADSGGHGLLEPSKEKLEALITMLREFTEVRLKPNLQRLRGQLGLKIENCQLPIGNSEGEAR
jgi:DNA repair photolyase